MAKKLPFYPFMFDSAGKENPKLPAADIKPDKALIDRIMAYSRALDVCKSTNRTLLYVMN
jgi:hypothetical protein